MKIMGIASERLKDRTTVEGRAKHSDEIGETQGGFFANSTLREEVAKKLIKYKEKTYKSLE